MILVKQALRRLVSPFPSVSVYLQNTSRENTQYTNLPCTSHLEFPRPQYRHSQDEKIINDIDGPNTQKNGGIVEAVAFDLRVPDLLSGIALKYLDKKSNREEYNVKSNEGVNRICPSISRPQRSRNENFQELQKDSNFGKHHSHHVNGLLDIKELMEG